MFGLGFLIRLLGWAKAIPLKEWLYAIAFIAVVLLYLFWAHHERAIGRDQDAGKITAIAAQLEQAQEANRSGADAIKALQAANHLCEAGRLADKDAQATALKNRDIMQTKLTADATAARATLQALLAGRCKAWAALPACGVTR
jgi:hypothetical protein